jgi:hypothetical protein
MLPVFIDIICIRGQDYDKRGDRDSRVGWVDIGTVAKVPLNDVVYLKKK